MQGNIYVNFVAIKNVERGDAAHIKDAIYSALSTTELCGTKDNWKDKLIGMGSDGASVMTGVRGGVIALIRRDLDKPIQGIHCSAHKLELAVKDCAKKVTICNKVQLLLLGIYLFYHGSNLNRSMLRRSFEMLGQSPLIPTRVVSGCY